MASKQDPTPSTPQKKKIPKLKDTPGSSYYKSSASQAQAEAQQTQNDANDESLTTILTSQQRTDLILLLAAATATMRDALSNTFDAQATLSPTLKQQTQSKKNELNPNVDPAKADVEALDRERKMLAAREKELSGPRMRELKDASLEWFDGWRTAMIGRVGEAVQSREGAEKEVRKNRGEVEGKKPGIKRMDSKVEFGDREGDGEGERAEERFRELFPPVKTKLTELEEEKRVMILHSLLLLLLSLEHYAAPGRVLLCYLTTSLGLSLEMLDEDETKTAQGLLEAAKQMSGDEETQKHAAENAKSRKWKVGLASVAGAAIIGVTGGLAAPLVAAGVGSVMGGLGLGATAAAGYLGTVAGSSVVVGGLFGAYGGRMTGQMMDNYAAEVTDFGFVPVHEGKKGLLRRGLGSVKKEGESEEKAGKQDPSERRLRVTIGITGWLTEKEEVVSPWKVLGESTEAFALRWELEALMNLGNSIQAMISSAAWGYAKKELIAHTIFADMMAAMWPIGLLKVSRVVDNPFSVAKSRAEKAGAVLADALINRAQGERPISLIGYSLGARVIYSCLLSLAARRAFGLIDSVVLIGAPLPSEGRDWRVMRSVVAGRLVNVYSENDYVLGFLYRTSSVQLGVAGLQKVEGVSGVENVDVSEAVSGHLRYRYLVGSILKRIGWEDLDLKRVKQEEEDLKRMDEEEERQKEHLKKKLRMKGKDDNEAEVEADAQAKGGKGGGQSEQEAEDEAQQMEKDVQEKTQTSLMQRGAEWLHLGSSGKEKAKDESEKQQGEGDQKGYLSSVASLRPHWPSWKKAEGEEGDNKTEGTQKAGAESKEGEKGDEKPKQSEADRPRSYLEMASGGYFGSKR